MYDLSAFPTGTATYTAFKLIEDPENPGKISRKSFNDVKAANPELAGLGMTSLDHFPRGSNVIDAQKMLAPKASQMLALMGVPTSYFEDPMIIPLKALAILNTLPDSTRDMQPLYAGVTSIVLAVKSQAAKKLVAMGYESLHAFVDMKAFATATVTAKAALAQAQRNRVPAVLPLTTAPVCEPCHIARHQFWRTQSADPIRLPRASPG